MKSSIQIKKIAQEVIKIELEQIENLVDRIDEDFIQAIKLISSSKGRLIVAGVGKSANISSKLVATFNSTGQPAIFLHSVILAKVLKDSFQPDMVAGHSLGEISALVAAKVLSFEDGLNLVYQRAFTAPRYSGYRYQPLIRKANIYVF